MRFLRSTARTLATSALPLAFLLVSTSFVSLASAQQIRIPREALREPQELIDLFQAGERLKTEGRWGEALSHFERALKSYPHDSRVKHELQVARVHVDVRRRFADPSYTDMLRTLSLRESLEVYREILIKVQTFHVDEPNWSEFVRVGSEGLAVALQSEEFGRLYGVRLNSAEVGRMREYLAESLKSRPIQDRYAAEKAVQDLSVMISEVHGLDPQVAVLEFACGVPTSLDWYSSFLTVGQYSDVMSQIDGNFVGLGIELKPKPEFLDVISVISTGPAGRGGLVAGDRIVAVDSHRVTEIGGDEAADRLRGPEGSVVVLTVQNAEGRLRDLNLERARVEIPSVEQARLVDEELGVGYIKLTSFQRTTLTEVSESLWKLHRQGMQSLVIDLRGNPGGLLDAAVDVADLFLTSGKIVTTKGRNRDENSVHHARFDGTWRVPLVVLIDGDSASASEILAGALRDNGRATVVGHRSYGKGTVQGIFALNSCSAGVRLTTAKFYSPNGRAISQAGIEPDIAVTDEGAATQVPMPGGDGRIETLKPQLGNDRQLEVAWRVATRQLQPLTASNN